MPWLEAAISLKLLVCLGYRCALAFYLTIRAGYIESSIISLYWLLSLSKIESGWSKFLRSFSVSLFYGWVLDSPLAVEIFISKSVWRYGVNICSKWTVLGDVELNGDREAASTFFNEPESFFLVWTWGGLSVPYSSITSRFLLVWLLISYMPGTEAKVMLEDWSRSPSFAVLDLLLRIPFSKQGESKLLFDLSPDCIRPR